MKLATTYSRAQLGVEAPLITIEVQLSPGLPRLSIVGLAETAVKESKDRVRAALLNSRFNFPSSGCITINLAPADLPKEGARFDLAIAVGILAATGQLDNEITRQYEIAGELSLSGHIRPVSGIVPMVVQAKTAGRTIIVPKDNQQEAAFINDAEIYLAGHLLTVCDHFKQLKTLPKVTYDAERLTSPRQSAPDLRDVKGQHQAKRALEIAAAGRHNMLLSGPPGTGKSMLADRLPGILPPPNEQEALEIAEILSITHKGISTSDWHNRPFRSPHHTASSTALTGGGSPPRPGEISLAHQGVLFLDELPEYNRKALESLREPLETGKIHISRAAYQVTFPAKFQLIAAMNPCPCGYFGDADGRCSCSANQIRNYRTRLSGPLLDRIDIQLHVPALQPQLLRQADPQAESSETVRQRVICTQQRQWENYGKASAELKPSEIEKVCQLDQRCMALLDRACQQLQLSTRAYHRTLRLSRTIADLDQQDRIAEHHLFEALSYRALDRASP